MGEMMTIEEIEARYAPFWVLIGEPLSLQPGGRTGSLLLRLRFFLRLRPAILPLQFLLPSLPQQSVLDDFPDDERRLDDQGPILDLIGDLDRLAGISRETDDPPPSLLDDLELPRLA